MATKEITAATVNRVENKSGVCLGYLVKSNSSDEYYQCTWNAHTTRWECNCAAGQHGRPCCHLAAVQQVLKARRATIAAAMGGEVPAIVARMQAQEDAKYAEQERTMDELSAEMKAERARRQHGRLESATSRGFSLMR